MGHVHKRLYSTATKLAISPTSTRFPPIQAFKPKITDTERFDAGLWAALQPPPQSALSAFAHRVGLPPTISSHVSKIQQACIHPTFLPFHKQYYPKEALPPSNAQLAVMGNTLMGLFATEFLHATYPHLPLRVLKAAVSAHVGPATCASVAQEMGASPLLRWHRQAASLTHAAVMHTDALSSIPRALTGLLYTGASPDTAGSVPLARAFVHRHFLDGRQIDLRPLLKFTNPKKSLMETVKKFGRESPKSRLLRETGRFSQSPVFVVGIFSGADQLGEGFGSSLRMAEFRAAEDALHRVYLTRTPQHLLSLPSSTFPSTGSVFSEPTTEDLAYTYVPNELGDTETNYASAGKARATAVVVQSKV